VLGGTAVLALLLPWLALRTWRRWGWRLVIGERRSGDRLRREAGRLLAALGATGLEGLPALRAELLRLRYGPCEGAKAAGPVFLEAGRHLRSRRLAAVKGWLRPRRST
jgi:hypothetical protein